MPQCDPMPAFDEARDAVANGTAPDEAARALVAAMTPEERLWCVDGDAPTWAGLAFLGDDGYHKAPFRAGEVDRLGLQRHVLGCVKHFACNSMENARFSVDIEVDDVPLHEVFLPHFRRIVDAGVAAVMSAYNSVNGDWCGQNRTLLTEVLRDEWGFQGFVI